MQSCLCIAVRDRHRGFSLIELAVCIMIIGIIVVASVRIVDRVEDAKVAAVAKTARRINEIAAIVYETTGEWPANTKQGCLPPEMEPFLSNPIMGNSTPVGGTWHWNGPNGSLSDSVGVAICFDSEGELNKGLLMQLDWMIDNGDLSSGACRITSNGGASCYVMAADAPSEVSSAPAPLESPTRKLLKETTSIGESIFSPSFAEPIRPEVP